MTKNEKLREILESANKHNREITVLGIKFQITGNVSYVYYSKDKFIISLYGVEDVTIPFDVITSII